MYPLETSQPFLKNEWYIAASGKEVGRQLLARKILNEPIVFYRTEAGEAVALWGLCPHRHAPLELGTLRGDTVTCGYHGFAFSPDGECVDIPVADTRPARCGVKRYPLAEVGPWIWIWMGDERAPDYAKLPDLSDIGMGNDPAGWRVDIAGYTVLQARSQLLVDNLFDLTHIAFVHAASFPEGTGAMALVRPQMRRIGERFRVAREVSGVPILPDTLLGYMLPEESGQANISLHTEFYNVSFINATGPWVWRAEGDGSNGADLGKFNFAHCITPETEHTTHYFNVLSRNVRLDDDAFSETLIAQTKAITDEDRAMLQAIEAKGVAYADPATEVSVFSDAGAIRVRMMIKSMFEKESAGRAREVAHDPV